MASGVKITEASDPLLKKALLKQKSSIVQQND